MGTNVQNRLTIAAELKKRLPRGKYEIFPNRNARDAIGKPTLIMARQAISPMLATSRKAYRMDAFQLVVVSHKDDEGVMEDLIDEVLDALEDIDDVFFETAEASTFNEVHRAYDVKFGYRNNRQTQSTTTQKEA
ncbi:hypothetical protein DOU02_06710 [Clavibacter michiganensis subsp. michiganensis]|uniref:hypothetical protein n=1 Tax=Clavibacter michiganensis TaxID=28447 RepID=UPI001303EC4B|nr:hypothetical protein [Clavibacter michiganensis]KAF0258769.1 hypothetical protein DOU02_06710 [Clavibacter michiganensis subsp. michiganensis]